MRVDPNLGAVSRTHKPIPNIHLQAWVLERPWLNYWDGELIVGDPCAPDVFNKTQSAFMSQGGTPDISYYVFDHWLYPQVPYDQRLQHVTSIFDEKYEAAAPGQLFIVPQTRCNNPEEVIINEEDAVSRGYEGLILRSLDGRYKNGRSTFKEGLLLKFKRREDAEATIIGFEALQRNQNEQVLDAFGYAKRSAHKAGKVADDLLGALIVEHPTWGQFAVGSGFDDSTRVEIWQNQDKYRGRQVSFTYTPRGMKDKPRFPIFKGIRHD